MADVRRQARGIRLGPSRLGAAHEGGNPATSIAGRIVLGLIAGFVASKIVNKTGKGRRPRHRAGHLGAIAGGSLFAAFGAGVTGLNLYSMLVAVVGAVVVLVVYHLVTGRRAVTRARDPRSGTGAENPDGSGLEGGASTGARWRQPGPDR